MNTEVLNIQDMLTIHKAAKCVRKATGHVEFTVDNLRHHMVCDSQKTVTIAGKVYVERDYIESLIYRLGKAGY